MPASCGRESAGPAYDATRLNANAALGAPTKVVRFRTGDLRHRAGVAGRTSFSASGQVMRPSIYFSAVLLALLVAGCAERTLGPGDVSGSYGLLRYDNDTLPRTYTAGGGCWAQIVAGALDLQPDGTFTLEIDRDQVCPNGPLSWVNLDASGTYGSVSGAWLALDDPAAGTTYLAWLKGTHVVVRVPQVPLIGGSAVDVEFSAQAANNPNVAVPEGGCCVLPPPPPDTAVLRP